MQFTKLGFAVLTAMALPVASHAGVTITPLVGHYSTDESQDKQPGTYTLSTKSKGYIVESDTSVGGAVGVDLTDATQLQVEYGEVGTDAKNRDGSVTHDAKIRNVSANLLVGAEQFMGENPYTKFKPYALVGVGESTTKIKDGESGDQLMRHKDTIGNVGVGARYTVTDNVALRGEARGVYNFENKWWDSMGLAGVEVSFGGDASLPRVSAPSFEPISMFEDVEFLPIFPAQLEGDDDGDGVYNSRDMCPNTPRHLAVDERGCPEQIKVAEHLQLELRVFFDYDKSDIKPQFRPEVAKVAQAMREFPGSTAVIEGHASKESAKSKSSYNQRLSEARAQAVRAMLINEFGVPAERLRAIGYGYDRPIASNDTEEGRAMNRRVIANIQGDRVQTVERTK